MKPLYLEMEGFGPYLNKTEIDFKKLPNYLTLVSGNTGAGKTTIFDAICCALFGETSGKNRSFSQMRSEFAQDKIPTKVRFKFELQGKTYEVTRSPSYRRKKRNSTDYTQVNQKAQLILPDGSVINNANNVTEKIKEILGIQKDEFRQIVMIAQNDFMSMIVETEKKQEEIFNRIFNAQLYEKFSRRILREKNDYDNKVTLIRQNILNSLDNSNLNFEEDFNDEFLETTKILDLVKEKKKEIETQKGLELAKLNQFRKKLQEARNKENEAQSLIKIFDQRDQASEQLKDLNKRKKEIQELKKRKNLAEKARDLVLTTYNAVQSIQENNQKLETKKNDLKKNSRLIVDELKINKKRLEKFSNETLDELHHNFKSLEDSLDQYKKLSEAVENFEYFKEEVNLLTDENEELETLLKEKEELFNSIEILSESEFIHKAQLLELESKNLNKELSDIKEIDELILLVNKLINHLIHAREELAVLNLDYKKRKKYYEKGLKTFINNQAAFLAQTLEENEPCPVCGSLKHPQPAQFTGEEITDEKLEILKSEQTESENRFLKGVDKYNQLRQNLINNLNNLINTSENLKALLDKNDQNKLIKINNLLNSFIQIIKEDLGVEEDSIKISLEDLRNLIFQRKNYLTASLTKTKTLIVENHRKNDINTQNKKNKESLEKEINEVKKNLENLTQSLKNKENLLSQYQVQIEMLKEQLKFTSLEEAKVELRKRKDKYLTYRSQFDSIKKNTEELKNTQSRINGQITSTSNQLKEGLINLEKENLILKEALSKAEFKDLNEFKNYCLDPKELELISNKINDYYSNLTSTQNRIQELNKILENSATRF